MFRVVVTGMAGISPIGNDWQSVSANLKAGKNGIRYMQDWEKYEGLNTRLAGVAEFEKPEHYTRKMTRSMGRVALMSVISAEQALKDAGLLNDPEIQNGSMGVAYGSSTGSTDAVCHFGLMKTEGIVKGITANSYVQMMPHTCPVNIALFFGLKGRIMPTGTACTSGSQGIGYAYESIKFGKQKMMIAGGAEELCPTEAAVFDVMYATSTKNTTPSLTPSPFDKDRDGLVIGEGAGTFILEELEHAKARGAHIYAEIVGFGTNIDGVHITQPSEETMLSAAEEALTDAGLQAQDIGYVNAHATATELGDIAESRATYKIFGNKVPVSSIKGFLGHTLGASGSLESWISIMMMHEDWFAPNLNLKNVDERCAELDYITGNGRHISTDLVMNNNFAFGGINTSLIFKRW
jgi:3-oxoacyl-[acyl-carrier-protein] synthase II